MGKLPPSIKIRRNKKSGGLVGINPQAVQNMIEEAMAPLQEQIGALQTNAMTTMVVLCDIRNSVIVAQSSTESTKRVLQELIDNIGMATYNIKEYVGAPQRILNVDYIEPAVAQETLNRARDEYVSLQSSEDGDDIIENVSEEYEDYEYEASEEDSTSYEEAVAENNRLADDYDERQRRVRPRR